MRGLPHRQPLVLRTIRIAANCGIGAIGGTGFGSKIEGRCFYGEEGSDAKENLVQTTAHVPV